MSLYLKLYEAGSYELAVEYCHKQLMVKPDDLRCLCTLGMCLYYVGVKLSDTVILMSAAKAFDDAIMLNPTDATNFNNRANVFLQIGKISVDRSFFDAAINCFDNACQLDPNYIECWLNKGAALIDMGKRWTDRQSLEAAVVVYDHLISINGTDVKARQKKGYALFVIGKTWHDIAGLDAAIAAYNAALLLIPNDAELLNDKANVHAEIGRRWGDPEQLMTAVAAYDRALQIDTSNAKYWYHRGNALLEYVTLLNDQETLDDAIASYNKAIAIKSDDPRFWNNKAVGLKIKGQKLNNIDILLEGADACDEAIKHDSKHIDAWTTKGAIYSTIGDISQDRDRFEVALLCIDQALQLRQNDTIAWHNKGAILINIGNIWDDVVKVREGIVAFDQSLTQDNNYTEVYYNKALALLIVARLVGESDEYQIYQNFLRAYYLDKRVLKELLKAVTFFSDKVHAPHFVNRLLTDFPFLQTNSRKEQEYAEATRVYTQHRNRLVQAQKELKQQYSGDELQGKFYLLKAIGDYLGGDPVAAFELHDNVLDSLAAENLQHQYYYCLSAGDILNPEYNAIIDYAVKYADEYLASGINEPLQNYYAACVYMLVKYYNKAVKILTALTDANAYAPAWFKLLECYDLTSEDKKKLTITDHLFKSGSWTKLNRPLQHASACAEMERLIQQSEAMEGWYAAGVLMSNDDEQRKEAGVRPNRFRFNESTIEAKMTEWPEPTLSEISDLNPERLEILKQELRLCLPLVFEHYEDQTNLDEATVAGYLYNQMLDEEDEEGDVVFGDYLKLLDFLFSTEKIGEAAFVRIAAFLNLKRATIKVKVFNRKRALAGLLIKEIFIIAKNAIAGALPVVPINLILLLVLENSDESIILKMDYSRFLAKYNKLKSYEPNVIKEMLTGNEYFGEMKEWGGQFL